jgi:hypothetical protein
MSQVVPESLVAIDPSCVISRKVHDEALIIHLTSGSYYSLNEVGARVWENIDGTHTAGDLAQIIQDEYNADPERIRLEVMSLLDDLASEGLIQVD